MQTTPPKTPSEIIRSAREGQVIYFPIKPIETLRKEFEEKTKKTLLAKAFNAFSCASPLILINLYSGLTTSPRSLSSVFGSIAMSCVAAATTSYLAYKANKFLINRAKTKADTGIREYISELGHAADSNAQYNYVQNLSTRIKDGDHITLKELGKLVNVRDEQLKDADFRLRMTVSNAKDWLDFYNKTNATTQRSDKIEPISPLSPLKARVHYPTAFRLTTLNLRYNAETTLEATYNNLVSGLKNFSHVMFEDPKAKHYLAPYTIRHTVAPIVSTFYIGKIIQSNETPDKQRYLPALKPSEYQ